MVFFYVLSLSILVAGCMYFGAQNLFNFTIVLSALGLLVAFYMIQTIIKMFKHRRDEDKNEFCSDIFILVGWLIVAQMLFMGYRFVATVVFK